MKLLLENWREYLLTEATLPGDASMIAIDPQRYAKWTVTGGTEDLKSYISFNLAKYLEVFEEEGGNPDWGGRIAQRASEYFYSAVNTASGCKTIDGKTAYQTSGVAGAPGYGWTAYKVAAGDRAPAPIMAHRDPQHHTTPEAAEVWHRLVRGGAEKIELDPNSPCVDNPGLNFALKLDGLHPTDVTGELTEEQIKGLLMAWAQIFEDRYKGSGL